MGGESQTVCERVMGRQAPRLRAGQRHRLGPWASPSGTLYMPERKERMCFLCLLKMILSEGPRLLAGGSLTPLCQKMIFHRC